MCVWQGAEGREGERQIEKETERQEVKQALTEWKLKCPKEHREIRKMVLGQVHSSFHISNIWRQINSGRRNYLPSFVSLSEVRSFIPTHFLGICIKHWGFYNSLKPMR